MPLKDLIPLIIFSFFIPTKYAKPEAIRTLSFICSPLILRSFKGKSFIVFLLSLK